MAEIELSNLRTYTRKVFQDGNVKRYNCHIGNIHYPDSNDVLQDINTTLLTKAGGMFQDKNFYACEVPDLATGDFLYYNKDHNFDLKLIGIKPQGYSLITPNAVGYAPIPNDPWGNIGKGIRYSGVFGANIHFEVIAKNSKFDKRLRIDAPPPLAYQSVPIGIVFEILTKPDILEIGDETGFQPLDINLNEASAPETNNKIWRIRNSLGQKASFIRRPKCWDSSGRALPVKIKFYRQAGRFFLVKIIPPEIWQNAVYPVYADDPVSYYAGAGDGWVNAISAVTWAASHDATNGEVADYTSANIQARSFSWGAGDYNIYRGFLPFDTSGIVDGDSITSADLYLYVAYPEVSDNDGDDWANIVQPSQASSTSLVTEDYDQCGAVSNPTEGSTRKDLSSGITSEAYNVWGLNATGLGWISKTGYTLLGIREGHDALNSAIGDGLYSNLVIYSSEETGTSKDPYLDVISAAGGGAIALSHCFIID